MLIIWGLLLLFVAPPIGLILIIIGIWIETANHMEKVKHSMFNDQARPSGTFGIGLELYRQEFKGFVKSLLKHR